MSSSWVVDVDCPEPQANMEGWVMDMEKQLEDAEPPAKVLRWPKHGIFRVPLRFKMKTVDGMYFLYGKMSKLTLGEGGRRAGGCLHGPELKFLEREDAPEGTGLGLHPLDIYRTSRLKGTSQIKSNRKVLHRGMPTTPTSKDVSVVRPESVVPRSAWKLSEAGIQFLPSKTSCLDDIELYMPKVEMDDSTTYRIHNMMAFEAMHVGTGNDVTAYVLFVKDLINSADDVQLLERKGILEHDLADDDNAVVRLFNSLTRDVSKNWKSQPCQVSQGVDHHYRNNHLRVFLYGAWSNLRNKYFKSLWTLLALVTAILLVVGDIL
nr:uncharacterized protein LOC109747521 [Aegilops tauschii subsp. strangulata]